MTEFENLKSSYISAIQYGLGVGAGYNQAKYGNDVLHKFCEKIIDNSNYCESDKSSMKNELEIIKEILSKEIEAFHKKSK